MRFTHAFFFHVYNCFLILRNIAPIRINKFTYLINSLEYYQSPIVI